MGRGKGQGGAKGGEERGGGEEVKGWKEKVGGARGARRDQCYKGEGR